MLRLNCSAWLQLVLTAAANRLVFETNAVILSAMARKNPKRNISRIEIVDSNGKINGGWQVRIQRRGVRTEKFFSDAVHGGKRAALQWAKEFRDELEQASSKFTVEELSEVPSARNRSGIVGVRLHHQKDRRGEFEYYYWYWVAQWTDGHGKRRTKSFSVHQYGDDEAYRLACEARLKGVSQAKR
ncbi:MAG: AP2/ERF family transcription factor [Mariniblastus sp.]